MEQEVLSIVSQFGAAGLIGLMWIVERRQASVRERQLSEAHARLAGQGHALDAMLGVVKDNTRAISTLEQTQRQLVELAQEALGRARRPHAGAA